MPPRFPATSEVVRAGHEQLAGRRAGVCVGWMTITPSGRSRVIRRGLRLRTPGVVAPSHPLDELAVYAVGALERPEVETVEAHLAECPACRAELAEHHEALARLVVDEPPPAQLWCEIRAAIAPGHTVVSVTVALMGMMAALLVVGPDGGDVSPATGTGRWRPARWPGRPMRPSRRRG